MRLKGLVVLLAAICALAPWSGVSAHKYKYRQLYSFCSEANCTDGANPYAALVMDGAGNLYGTTTNNGANGQGLAGTVFELVSEGRRWKHKTLYDFCSEANCADGADPTTSLILDMSGNLYGAAAARGAHNSGVAFKLNPNGAGRRWKYTDLYDFCTIPANDGGCEDGNQPYGSMTYAGAASGALYDGSSPLYGATRYGGDDGLGWGTVFKLRPGQNTTLTVVYAFCRQANCADGSTPSGGVIMDASGDLYGSTKDGGDISSFDGVVFKVTTKGRETVLYTFCPGGGPCQDGANPMSPLLDFGGSLVGTTYYGGANGAGTIFQVTGGSEVVLHDFCSEPNCADSKNPTAGLIADTSGHLYGTASGYNGAAGTIFQLDGNQERDIYEFCCGHVVTAGLIRDTSGNLFGVTYNGGDNNSGSVFELEY